MKNVLFFIRDYLKFFTVMGGWLTEKHCLLPHEKFSGNLCFHDVHSVLFKKLCVKTYFCL